MWHSISLQLKIIFLITEDWASFHALISFSEFTFPIFCWTFFLVVFSLMVLGVFIKFCLLILDCFLNFRSSVSWALRCFLLECFMLLVNFLFNRSFKFQSQVVLFYGSLFWWVVICRLVFVMKPHVANECTILIESNRAQNTVHLSPTGGIWCLWVIFHTYVCNRLKNNFFLILI